jgi:chromosome segregation ATPase
MAGEVVMAFSKISNAISAAWMTLTEGGDFAENYERATDFANADSKNKGEAKKKAAAPDSERKKADDDKSKADAAAKALEEEMTNLARSRMNDEQKITDLKREQAELAAAAQDKSKSDTDRLNATREVLRVQQEIESIQKRVDDAAAKADEEAEKAIADFYEAEAKAQEEADKEAEDALKEAYEAEAKAAEEAASSAPTIVSSSLASIGGGGSSYVSQGSNPALVESRKQTALLQRLVANTGGTAAMATNSPF